jgi:hypothetical protein
VFYKGPRLHGPDPRELALHYNRGVAQDKAVLGAIEEFCSVTDFTGDAMRGYDPLDLFYWEHRMGLWHSWLCTEADIAHDTFPIFSHRRLLELLLSVQHSKRESSEVFELATKRLWPQLMDWPINPRKWPQ